MTMNKSAQEHFDMLLDRDLKELTKEDKEFLVARRSYMNPVQKEIYKDILPQEVKVEVKPEVKETKK